jgi:hypothetical protein
VLWNSDAAWRMLSNRSYIQEENFQSEPPAWCHIVQTYCKLIYRACRSPIHFSECMLCPLFHLSCELEMARDPYRMRVCRHTRAGAVQNLNDRQCAGITQFMFSIHAWRKSRSTLGASTYDQPPHSHRAKNLKTCAQIILSLRERRK